MSTTTTPSTQATPQPVPDVRTPEGYRTSPDHENPGWPPGVPYIIGNEACERFSFYGMRAILAVHLASLFVQQNMTEKGAEDAATAATHLFMAGVYALPMIGAIIAERLAGKFRTILYLSLVYCMGHVALSIGENFLLGMFIGLALISIGSGGIKPCVSANVGDQFGKKNWSKVRTVFQIFYFSINFGSFFSTLLIPWIKDSAGFWVINAVPSIGESISPERLGISIAFAVPGVLMFIATFIFWLGRRQMVHVPPKPGGDIGLLDAVSSTLLFLSVGHLFVTPELLKMIPFSGIDKFIYITSVEHIGPAGMEDTAIQINGLTVAGLIKFGIYIALTALFLTSGLVLFNRRQRKQQDDGFLAILVYAWQHRGQRTPPRDADTSSPTTTSLPSGAGVLPATSPSHVTDPAELKEPSTAKTNLPLQAAKLDTNVSTTAPAQADMSWLRHSSFWGPAVDRFGLKAVEGPVAVFKILSVFFLISIFWALFDQHSSSWIFQAKAMDRWLLGASTEPGVSSESKRLMIFDRNDPNHNIEIENFELKPSQIPALNPLMVMILIPLMNLIYARLDRMGLKTTPLRRITVGMIIAGISFAAVALIQTKMDYNAAHAQPKVSVFWQIIPYLLITIAEVLVSITGLEFAYTQAPARMKSTIMGFWLLAVALGNVLVAFLAGFEKLPRVDFFWVFAGLSIGAGVLFGLRALVYTPKDYTQE